MKYRQRKRFHTPSCCRGRTRQVPRQVVVEVGRALLTICPATLVIIIIIINIYSGWPRKSQRPIVSGLFPLGATKVEEKKTVRKAPASSQGSFVLLYYPIFGFFCLVILFLCLSNFTNTVFVEFLTNKHF